MATVVGSLLLKLTGDTADARQSIDKVEKKAKGFSKFIKGAMGIGGAVIAFRALKNIAKDLTAAYGIQETAEAKLRSAITSTGKEGSICAEKLFRYASQLQGVTTYGDEATISAMALLQQLGDLSEEGIKQLMPLIQDMAAALGVDLETAASLVGKTVGSTTNALSRYGIQIDATAPKEEKVIQLTEEMAKKFGGLSRDLATTGTGAMIQLNNILGDIKEQGGKKLLEFLTPAIKDMTDMATRTLQTVSANRLYNMALKGGISSIQEANLAIEESHRRLTEQEIAFANVNRASTENEKKIAKLTEAEKTAVSNRSSAVYQLYAERAALNSRREGIEENIKKEQESMTLFRNIRTALEQLQTIKTADVQVTAAQVEETDELGKTIKQLGEYSADYYDGINSFLLTAPELAQFYRDLDKNVNQTTESIKDQADEVMTLNDGLNFAGTVLSSLGDLYGQYYENRYQELENEYEARKTAIEANIADEEARSEALTNLDNEFEERRKAIAIEEAKRSRNVAVFESIIHTANAVMAALATVKPTIPWGIAAAILVGAIGATKTAMIAAQPLPAFAAGADFVVPPGYPNDSYIFRAESGEHVEVTPPEAAAPASMFHISLYFAGRHFYDEIHRASADGSLVIHPRSIRK